jgi:membrane fusion protein (multidrug efflux system)
VSARRALTGATAALCLAALAPLGCERQAGPERREPRPAVVEVVRVAPEPFRNTVEFVGQLNAEETVVVRSEISGVIDSIEFDEGQPVRAEQVLFGLRDDEQWVDLRRAEARAELTAEVLSRTQQLESRQISAAAELDRARAEHRVARAEVERARVELDRTLIRAPFDGVAGARAVSPGDRVDPDTDLVQIDKVDRLQLVFTVPEVGIRVVRRGLPLSVRVAPFPDRTIPGEIFFIGPTTDPRTRRFLVKAWIADPGHEVQPGMFANVRLELDYRPEALLIPESAIVYDSGGAFVWRVVDGTRAERAPVELGLHAESRVVVRSGLEPGDLIVSAGTNKVIPGGTLVVRERPPSAAPAESSGNGRPAEQPGEGEA